jgi:hypothetical protein
MHNIFIKIKIQLQIDGRMDLVVFDAGRGL